ncbi:uncharacterized protein LOC111291630 [Durio zibethinus]|uniref:Uncharacterized protein LOC111291630 n=1 Tax=Durio zibethinus TaxID=66656 RepID=A0A6P5YFL5_DURZI|nr:uncharacterized protein LOC111291630 [Durio zibethinus]
MTKYPLFFLLFLFSISAFAAEHHHLRPLPPPPPPLHQHQLNNIIDALIGAGDFNNWANMLSAYDLLMLPLSATLFVPSDDSFFPFPVPTSSTTAASFDLLSSLTTLSLSNFTLDASRISYPDLYLTSAIAVHGIAALLNYTVYGGDAGLVHGIAPPPPPPPPMFEPVGEVKGDRRRSDAGCLNREFAFVLLLIPWVVWA